MSSTQDRAFSFIKVNQRERKPRTPGITEIRVFCQPQHVVYGPEVNLFVDHSQIVQLEC